MLGFDGEYPAAHPNAKFWRLSVKYRQKSAAKQENVFYLISLIFLQPFVRTSTVQKQSPGKKNR